MQVVVCVKQIPDPAGTQSLDPDTHNLVRPDEQVLDDTDRYGVEMGLQLAQLHRPAALVVDLFLPNESGAWFIEQVNAIPGFEHIPIVVWTVGDVSPTEHARLLAFPNVREIVSKGPGATPLIEVLRQVLPPLAQEAKDAR